MSVLSSSIIGESQKVPVEELACAAEEPGGSPRRKIRETKLRNHLEAAARCGRSDGTGLDGTVGATGELPDGEQHIYIQLKVRVKSAGSFYHFMLGEFLPVLQIIVDGGLEDCVIHLCEERTTRRYRDKTKNFRSFYAELPFRTQFVSGRASDPCHEVCRLDKSDLKFKHDTPKLHLQQSVGWLKSFALNSSMGNTMLPEVIFQKRDPIASMQRSVRNVQELYDHFQVIYPDVPVALSVPEGGTPLLDQMRPYLRARLIIGEHGSGLLHAFWTPPGATIIELATRDKIDKDYFHKLGEVLGFNVVPVEVDAKELTASSDDVFAEIDLALRSLGLL